MYGIRTELGDRLAKVREEEENNCAEDFKVRVDSTCEIPSERIRTQKGSMNVIEVEIGERGTYLLEMEVRSEIDNELAQIPMAVSIGSQSIETISLNGAQKEWKKISVSLPSVMSFTFCLKLFFALGGMGIRNCRLSLLASQEDDVADHLSGRQTEQ